MVFEEQGQANGMRRHGMQRERPAPYSSVDDDTHVTLPCVA